jgi:tetratricopeptide (TPR) repeat protein
MRKRREKRRAAREAAMPAPARARFSEIPFLPAAAVLLAAALALYWSGLRFPLVFDDHHVTAQALSSHHAHALGRFGPRWLTDTSFWWIHVALGKDVLWQRLANVFLHAATAALLFGFLARLFEAVLAHPRARLMAFFGAAVFLLHPVAVYGVAYLVERSIVLATLFCIVALWCVLEGLLGRSAKPGRWYWAAGAAYLLAMSSKEHAVMLPAVAAGLAVLVHGASLALARRLAFPLALLALIAVLAVLRFRQYIGTAYEPFVSDVLGPGAQRPQAELAYPLSVLNQATLFFRYLLTWILPWPGWMSVDMRTAFPRELLAWPYAGGFAAWIAYPFLAAWLLTRRGALGLLGFGLLYPWLLFLTEVATVRAQEPFVLYRSYLWMSGLPAALPLLLERLGARRQATLLALLCAALVLAAHERLQSFSSPLALWSDAIRKNDEKLPLAERAYVARGLVHLDAQRLAEAGKDFEQAVRMNPAYPDAWLGRGSFHLRSARLAEARADLDRAVALDPKYASAYDKRCVVITSADGPAQGLADCEKAVQLDPANHEAWINLGAVYHALRRPADAKSSFERALAIAPNDGSANYNYGVLLLDMGRRDEATRRHIEIGCEAGIPSACDIMKRSRRAP